MVACSAHLLPGSWSRLLLCPAAQSGKIAGRECFANYEPNFASSQTPALDLLAQKISDVAGIRTSQGLLAANVRFRGQVGLTGLIV